MPICLAMHTYSSLTVHVNCYSSLASAYALLFTAAYSAILYTMRVVYSRTARPPFMPPLLFFISLAKQDTFTI